MKILLGDFNAKVGREDILQPTIVNESFSNDYGITVVNFATSKNLTVKRTMFAYYNTHTYTWNAWENPQSDLPFSGR
jgi:hypothetical protein